MRAMVVTFHTFSKHTGVVGNFIPLPGISHPHFPGNFWLGKIFSMEKIPWAFLPSGEIFNLVFSPHPWDILPPLLKNYKIPGLSPRGTPITISSLPSQGQAPGPPPRRTLIKIIENYILESLIDIVT